MVARIRKADLTPAGYPPETGGPPQPGYAARTRSDYPEQIGYPDPGRLPQSLTRLPRATRLPGQRGYQNQGQATPTKGRGLSASEQHSCSPGPAAGCGAPGRDRAIAKAAGPVAASPATAGTGSTGVAARHEEATNVLIRPAERRLTDPRQFRPETTNRAPRHTAGRDYGGGADYTATRSPAGPGIRSSGWRVRRTPPAETTTMTNQALGLRSASARWRSGYGQGGYGSAGTSVTLQLDNGSGHAYQLREGSNIIGPRTGRPVPACPTPVCAPSLEIDWDGQVALLADLVHQRHHC